MSTDGDANLELWLGWKRIHEVVRAQILAEVVQVSTLTEPEFTALAYLKEAGGTLRQNALASAAGWDRTRLSHLAGRMERRGLIAREKLRNGVELTMLEAGSEAFAATREPLIDAVDRIFAARLSPDQLTALRDITEALSH